MQGQARFLPPRTRLVLRLQVAQVAIVFRVGSVGPCKRDGGLMGDSHNGGPSAIGSWKLEKLLAEGPFATVYAVSRAGIQAHIQVVNMSRPDDDVTGATVLQNARRLRTFFSPEIATPLDELTLEGEPALVCDAPRGSSVADIFKRGKPLTPIVWTELARALLLGAAALRAGRVQCLQLTPRSVYIDTSLVSAPRVILADFWTAGPLDPDYCAPEFQSVLEGTSRADCFSIGRILLQAFAPEKHVDQIREQDAVAAGFTAEQFLLAQRLTERDSNQRLTVEQALRSLPGIALSTIPLFAQDAPHLTLRRRAIRKWASVGLIAGLVFALLAFGLPRVLNSLGPSPDPAAVEQKTLLETPDEDKFLVWMRLTKDEKLFPFLDSKTYTFRYCFTNPELSAIDEQRRVIVQKLDGEEWSTTPISVLVKQKTGCEGNSYLLEFTTRMPFVPEQLTSEWSDCVRYRVLVPDKGKEKRASIPYCVQAKNLNAT